MKQKTIALSRRYAAALRTHLKRGRPASLQPALGLGRESVAIGLETLDLARIHEKAVAAVLLPADSFRAKAGIIKRSRLFFTEAIIPIEETHRAAQEAKTRLKRLSQTLRRRTAESEVSDRHLQRGIVRRKTVEEALRKSSDYSRRLLKESGRLQKHLQRLTRQILSAHEDNRKKISHDLQDEIAQTLLGINVRLLSLKKAGTLSANGLRKEIASTQQLVDKSVKSIQRFARQFARPYET